MGIQDWSENVILVDLPQEPEMGDELKTVTEVVRDRGDCDVVIDFSEHRYHNFIELIEAPETEKNAWRLRPSVDFLLSSSSNKRHFYCYRT